MDPIYIKSLVCDSINSSVRIITDFDEKLVDGREGTVKVYTAESQYSNFFINLPNEDVFIDIGSPSNVGKKLTFYFNFDRPQSQTPPLLSVSFKNCSILFDIGGVNKYLTACELLTTFYSQIHDKFEIFSISPTEWVMAGKFDMGFEGTEVTNIP